ncbi:hypothetical protein [Streptomyces sp. NPDC003247]|uniref:hypothetical protein n=1 Tax=Streptomyces sp. NPDC003247 TaxID=3364677 RepID=UPI00369DCAA7
MTVAVGVAGGRALLGDARVRVPRHLVRDGPALRFLTALLALAGLGTLAGSLWYAYTVVAGAVLD